MIAAAIVVVALAGLAFALHGRGDDTCQSAAAELAPTWNPIRELAVHAAFGTTGLPYAESAWTSFHRGVARYADNWIALHREACVATRVRETQSTHVLDRRMACLDERRHELDALLRTYEHPAPAMLERAGELANHLSPLASCSDLEALAPVSNPELRNRLAELRASYSPTQLAEVRSIRDRARMLGDTALLASALELEGNLVAVAGDARAAEPILYRALESAELARADEVRAHTWISLVRVIGRDQAKLAEAKTFANLARSVATRLGAHVELTAALGFALVPVLTQAGDLDAAEREATSLVAPLSPLDPDRGVALGYLANVSVRAATSPTRFATTRSPTTRPSPRSAPITRALPRRSTIADWPRITPATIARLSPITSKRWRCARASWVRIIPTSPCRSRTLRMPRSRSAIPQQLLRCTSMRSRSSRRRAGRIIHRSRRST